MVGVSRETSIKEDSNVDSLDSISSRMQLFVLVYLLVAIAVATTTGSKEETVVKGGPKQEKPEVKSKKGKKKKRSSDPSAQGSPTNIPKKGSRSNSLLFITSQT